MLVLEGSVLLSWILRNYGDYIERFGLMQLMLLVYMCVGTGKA